MASIRRFRFWAKNTAERSLGETLARAAAAGETVEGLLQLAARGLLEAGRADRAAVLLRSEKEAAILEGSVVDSGAPAGPASRLRLDSVLPAVAEMMGSGRPLLLNLQEVARAAPLGPLAGMKSAAVLPLSCAGETLGVALLAYARDPAPEGFEALQGVADQLAVAVSQRRLAARVPGDDALRARAAATEATLAALLESGSEMLLLLDEEGTIQQGSRAAREKLGLDSACGTSPLLEEIFPPRRRKEIADWRRAAVSGKPPAPLELTLAGGTILRLRAQATRLPGGRWQAGLEDLTASRQDERRRKESDAELAAVLDSMESGMLLFDARGGLRLANARFAHLFGLDPRRVAEIADFEMLIATVRDRFREAPAVERRWREIAGRGDEAAWDELELLHPSRRVVERFARPVMGEEGKRIGWLELYRDITGERLIQSKLMQSEKMAALGQLVSGIAHELNNPLTGIMGYAQLLLSHELEGERAVEVRRIFEEAERAGRIVKNLLLFSREKKPERRPVNLNEIIERTLALRSYELKVQNIIIVRDLDPELAPVLADAHQLQQVVLNLLVNAEQAIQQDRGRGRITVRTRGISPQKMVLEVGDDGPGIPPEIAPRIFDPFFTTKPVGTGTGLGLSIVYGIVHEHGGEVTVETSPAHGTNFVIELPLFSGRAQEAQEETPHRAPAPVVARGRKILVIEDEPTVAQLVVDVLREEGHHAEAILDSVEGLDRILRQHFDLVICDLRMPRLDGRDLYASLVRRGNSAQHRIIFITGDTLTPHTLEFLESNALRYLAKPFLVAELREAVEQELEPAKGGHGRRPGPHLAPAAIPREKGAGPSRLLGGAAWRDEGESPSNPELSRGGNKSPIVQGNEGSGAR